MIKLKMIKTATASAVAAMALMSVSSVRATDLTASEFERLHKEIRPRPGEAPWSEIEWMYDLHAARAAAARDGKPLCVWRMAGDPTGSC